MSNEPNDLIQQAFDNIPENTYQDKQFLVKQNTPLGAKMLEWTRHSNNLYNSTVFVIRNYRSAKHKQETGKPLTPNEEQVTREIIQILTRNITERLERVEKYKASGDTKKYDTEQEQLRKALKRYANYRKPGHWLISSADLQYIMKERADNTDYRALTAQAAQNVIKQVREAFDTYIKAHEDWSKNKKKYLGEPKLPHYKTKGGQNIVEFSNQDCTIYARNDKKATKYGAYAPDSTGTFLKFPGRDEGVFLDFGEYVSLSDKLANVIISPVGNGFMVHVRLKVPVEREIVITERLAGLDVGVDNLATIVTNVGSTPPIIIDGRDIKSVNQYYNKQIAKEQSKLNTNGTKTSRKLKRLWVKRNKQTRDYMHAAATRIVDYLVENQISVLVLGWNAGIKQGLHWRGGSSQSFVQLPFQVLRDDLRDKCWLAGILVIETEESFTSKSSLLDGDPLPVYDAATYKKGQFRDLFSGSRRYRGLYVSGSGVRVNADVNGAGNILRKVFPHAFDGVTSFGYVLNPVRERVGCFRYERAGHVRFCRGVGHASACVQ